MENNFNNRDFERFVKQNADQYRMFPSDKIWKNIHTSLHTRRRWYGIGLGLLLLSTATVTGVMLSSSGKEQQKANITVKPVKKQEQDKTPEIIIARANPANDKTSFITPADKFERNLFLTDKDNNIQEEVMNESVQQSTPDYPQPVIASVIVTQPEFISKFPAVADTKKTMANNIKKPAENYTSSAPGKDNTAISVSSENDNNKKAEPLLSKETVSNKRDIYPLTIESIVNAYKHTRARKKLSWQIYFTPTVSYRQLKENKAFLNAARPYTAVPASNVSDINSVVTHKPDIGFQLGFTAGYPLSKKVRITGGLQFNVSKYDILAFTYPSEVVTIALSTSAGGTNSVSTFTNYRNSGGSSNANWLRNLYVSASAPVGIEVKLAQKKKSYVGIAATVQPNYILSNRAYLLSTDYKNYAEVPSLVRLWNVNTGFEVFAGYSTGKLNWRVSPQVRYQTLSSFKEKYPVKEHLFDFGVKLGLMLRN